jgi:hypothetical protein
MLKTFQYFSHQLIEWLKGFQDVQIELNACVGCLEDGVSQINVLKSEEDKDMKPDKMAAILFL